MKNLIAAALLVCLSLSLTSCPTLQSTAVPLFPPAQMAWSAIEDDFDIGIADGLSEGDLLMTQADKLNATAGELEAALRAKDRNAVRFVSWTSLAPWASRGIDVQLAQGLIGPNGAGSLREQLKLFTETITLIQKY